jgi:TonB family protein
MKRVLIAVLLIFGCERAPIDAASPERSSTPRAARPATQNPATVSASTTRAPLRVGGDVRAPTIVRRVEPKYPEYPGSYRLGIVILEGVVTKDGDVRDLRVLKGPGNDYERAIVQAIEQWKFKPATLHGQPVDVIYNLTVNHVPYMTGG